MAFKMIDMSEIKTTSGTSFLLYGESGSRKTRTLGTLPNDSVSLHLSLDYGAASALESMEMLGIKAQHKVSVLESLSDLNEAIIALHTKKSFKDNIDFVIIDNVVILVEKIKEYVASTPKYKKDALSVEDMSNGEDKNATGSKMLPFFSDVQRLLRELSSQIMQLKADYNVIMLAGDILISDPAIADIPTVYPLAAGPKSIKPLVSIFDNVFTTVYKEGEFDSEEEIKTKFLLSTKTDMLTGNAHFAKTRSITDRKYLDANEIPADFRVIMEETGYVLKKDRKETK